jgi:ketosteroid isomerase-like protein
MRALYHFFVRRRMRQVIARLNAGDYDFIVAQFTADAEHCFAGTHALSGHRRSPARIRQWYQRLATVFPGIQFEVVALAVSGPPWHTTVALEWKDHVSDGAGQPLPNQGVFIFQLRWGKARSLHIHCDTRQLERNLEHLAAQGRAEARAQPITGA